MTTTLTRRKRWLTPQGTCRRRFTCQYIAERVDGMVAKPTMPIVAKVEELIVPLRGNSQAIFEEGDDDQESTNGRYISVLRQLRVLISTNPLLFVSIFPLPGAASRSKQRERTYGLIGSEIVSNQSSILLVCCRIASSGLGSLVASAFILLYPAPTPNRLGCDGAPPRL